MKQHAASGMTMKATLLSSCLLVFTGCGWGVQVAPKELVKLNDQKKAHGSLIGDISTKERLTAIDGRLIEVDARSPIRITTRDGSRFSFYQPIEATIDGEYLSLKSAKRGPARFPLASIESVEVDVFENR